FLFLYFAPGLVIYAQPPKHESLTIEQGLSQGMIFDILQTRDGFLWVATKDGLNRYDGYNFKVFSNNPFDPFSIAENTATKLFEDSRGWLWVGLSTKGADVYEPRTGRFHHFSMNSQGNNAEVGPGVSKILESSDGAIWALKRGAGLMRIRIPDAWKNGVPDEPDLKHLAQTKSFPFAGTSGEETATMHNFCLLKNGQFLATYLYGQFIFDPQTGDYQPVNEKLLPAYLNKAVQGDEAFGGDLWVGNQVEIRRIRNNQATVFPLPQNFNFQWCSFFPGAKGHVWVAINEQLWDIEPGEDLDFSKPDFTFDANATCELTDKNGNIWVGTVGYGLRKINPAKNLFHAGAAGVSVLGVWRDPLGRYYVKARKTVTNIFSYDPGTGKMAERTAFPDAPYQHIGLAFEPSGATWLLSTSPEMGPNGSLRRYDSAGRFVQDFTVKAMVHLSSPLLRTAKGLLWVATGSCQLARLDPSTGQFDYFDFGQLFGDNAGAVRALSLVEDGNGTFWVGTQLGLVKCTPKQHPDGFGFDFQLIKTDPNKREGLNNNSIACLLPAPSGSPEGGEVLWIGTKGGGINRLDLRSGQYQHITMSDGLPNNVVYGILPASHPPPGSTELWCSTNRGIAKIVLRQTTPLRFEIASFTAATGLQDNEFNTQAFSKADNGEMLFGGINGLNHFFPEQLRMDTVPPPVFIVGIEINHQKRPLPAPAEQLAQMELSHDQNNISIEFAALDFTDPSKNRYRYRLVGLDPDWVETSNLRFAHFSHLAPGRYTLRVQGNNGESAWSEARPLVIVVNPPWYLSNFAYLCYLSLLLWAGWKVYQFQIRRVKEREQLAFEQRETERVKAMEQMKTNFFTNVTHEFRTPLTLIVEPLRQLLKNPNDPERTEKIRLAEGNSRKLLGLVNQLLDMAKLESGQMTLDLRQGDLGQTVRDVFERFLPLAEKHGVKLAFAAPKPGDFSAFDFDPRKVELVLNNLISNALKFTPQGGEVRVTVDGGRRTADAAAVPPFIIHHSSFIIKVTDTGIGIAPENLSKIFDRFYQVDGSHTRSGEGTGIGLALSKELAELMGGGISVESEAGKGAAFTFWLPVGMSNVRLLSNGANVQIRNGEELQDLTIPSLSGLSNLPAHDAGRPVALVVEDNPELRRFIKTSIGTGWQVVEASDGEEGVKKAIELLPDIIISDLMMPRKDGYALCDELKNHELTAHIPIILLTAKAAMDSKLKGLRTGADDYLTKPFNTEELLARMDNLLETRRRLREHYAQRPTTLAAEQSERAAAFLSEPDRAFLEKTNRVMDEHLADERFSVDDFAQKMLISRAQLYRKIKALTDQNTSDYIRRYRLDRAYQMLKSGTGRVGEVSLLVGFGNEKYFSTVFKEHFGVSPSQVGP
ncbi:MAG: ATP-binding protein, partial [Saprospiraceae bacterium]